MKHLITENADPRKWVNRANMMDTEAAARLTGAADDAFEVIAYGEFLQFKDELTEFRELRERYASAKQKYIAEELKTQEFGLELRRRKEIIAKARREAKVYKFILLGWASVHLILGAMRLWQK